MSADPKHDSYGCHGMSSKSACDAISEGIGMGSRCDCSCHSRKRRTAKEQPRPKPNDRPAVWDLVKSDMDARDAKGVATYGTRLQPNNGRDALQDAYEEALDLAVYLRQAIYERSGK